MATDKTYICKEDLLEKMQYRLPVEVVSVVHGYWIPQYEHDFDACIDRVTGYTCSRCGKWSVEAGEECPNCHARMRQHPRQSGVTGGD